MTRVLGTRVTLGLVPRWKVEREIKRVKSQVSRKVADLYEPFVQRHHDGSFRQRVRVTPGAARVSTQVAVVLLFQPKGLAASVRLMLDELIRNGFSVVAVSNATLGDRDRAMLQSCCLAVAERPNFGYDFGGYRDGIRLVAEDYGLPDTLLLANDSIWFPLHAGDTTLARLLNDPAPFRGLAAKLFTYKERDNPYVQSHFMLMDRSVVHSQAFAEFWQNYRVSSDRFNAIHRGEMGFSRAISAAGFDSAGLVSPPRLFEVLDTVDTEELHRIVTHMVPVREAEIALRARLLASFTPDGSWHGDTVAALKAVVRAQDHLCSTAFVYAGLRHLRVAYLKKRNEPLFAVGRVKALELAAAGLIPPLLPEIESELRAVPFPR